MGKKLKRIRMSGNDNFQSTNIQCHKCKCHIIKNGDPQMPIYYKDVIDGNYFCPKCQNGSEYC